MFSNSEDFLDWLYLISHWCTASLLCSWTWENKQIESFHINHVVLPDHRQHQQKNLTSKNAILWSFWCCKPEHRGDSSSFDRSNNTRTWKGSWCCCLKKKNKSSSPLPSKYNFYFYSLFPSFRKSKLLSSFTLKLSCFAPRCLLARSLVPEQVTSELGTQQTKYEGGAVPRELSIHPIWRHSSTPRNYLCFL